MDTDEAIGARYDKLQELDAIVRVGTDAMVFSAAIEYVKERYNIPKYCPVAQVIRLLFEICIGQEKQHLAYMKIYGKSMLPKEVKPQK